MKMCSASLIIQFSSVQSLSCVLLFASPWIAARQASLSITNSQRLLKLMSIGLVMPSSHLILCRPLLFLSPIPPSIKVFSSESTLRMRWPKYGSFSFRISPSSEHPGLISFNMDWLDLFAVQGTLKSLLQHHSSKASIFREMQITLNQSKLSLHTHWNGRETGGDKCWQEYGEKRTLVFCWWECKLIYSHYKKQYWEEAGGRGKKAILKFPQKN